MAAVPASLSGSPRERSWGVGRGRGSQAAQERSQGVRHGTGLTSKWEIVHRKSWVRGKGWAEGQRGRRSDPGLLVPKTPDASRLEAEAKIAPAGVCSPPDRSKLVFALSWGLYGFKGRSLYEFNRGSEARQLTLKGADLVADPPVDLQTAKRSHGSELPGKLV